MFQIQSFLNYALILATIFDNTIGQYEYDDDYSEYEIKDYSALAVKGPEYV